MLALDKWYLDCVSPDGDLLICYSAKPRWGPIRLCYGARIVKPAKGPLTQRQSFFPGHAHEEPGAITWSNDRLGIQGAWTGGAPLAETTVVDEPSGVIVWRCLGANCAANIHIDGQRITGTGYVEELSMTIPPWKLPFTDLRWGRYISEDRGDYAVWIDLRGGTSRNWIWIGSDQTPGTVDDDGVHASGASLTFEASQPVRSENVARTLLGPFEFLKTLLPRQLGAIREDKQISSCVLTADGLTSRGFSVNEVVSWR